MYHESGQKYLTVEQLRAALAALDGDLLVLTNQVGNLAINSPDGEYVGYIDFAYGVARMDSDFDFMSEGEDLESPPSPAPTGLPS